MNSIILPFTIFQPQVMAAKLISLRELYQASIFVPIYHAFLPQIYSGIGISFCAAYSSILRVSSALYVHLCAEILVCYAQKRCADGDTAPLN
jgi:hypothetical protein